MGSYRLLLLVLVSIFASTSVSAADDWEIRRWPETSFSIESGKKNYDTPTALVEGADLPFLDDDLNFSGLEAVITAQLKYYKGRPKTGSIRFGRDTYPITKVADTLNSFLKLVQNTQRCIARTNLRSDCMNKFRQKVATDYNIYKPDLTTADPRFGQEQSTFFTAYYTATINASRELSAQNPYAIYARPADETLRRHTRVEIDFDGKLLNTGHELYYTNDPFEIYLLHVQGGGKIILQNGKQKEEHYLHFNGSNGNRFQFISKYMLAKGYIQTKDIETQHAFLLAHPELQREVFEYCPSYVYYTVSDTAPPGSGQVGLTPRRSLATDHRHYGYKGVLSFVQAQRPTEDSAVGEGPLQFKDFSRFMLDQDTGSAIQGKARVDLFHGEDHYAKRAAYSTQHLGKIFFLMLK